MRTDTIAEVMPRISAILGAFEALKNIRAAILTCLVLLASAMAFGLLTYLAASSSSWSIGIAGVVIAALVFLYGMSAVGFLLMNHARGAPRLGITDALMFSLVSTHRWIVVMLLSGALFALFAFGLLAILFVCKLPSLGPVLFIAVFPITTFLTAAFIAAMYFVILPLAFPAVWTGDTITGVIAKLYTIARHRLSQIIALGLLLGIATTAATIILYGFVLAAVAIVGALSAAVLPGTGFGMGDWKDLLTGLAVGAAQWSGQYMGYAAAASFGGLIIGALLMIAPALILVQGYCFIFLEVTRGLDLSLAEGQLRSKMEDIQQRARDAQQRMKANMQETARSNAVAGSGSATMALCPECNANVGQSDLFCGNCGFKLR